MCKASVIGFPIVRNHGHSGDRAIFQIGNLNFRTVRIRPDPIIRNECHSFDPDYFIRFDRNDRASFDLGIHQTGLVKQEHSERMFPDHPRVICGGSSFQTDTAVVYIAIQTVILPDLLNDIPYCTRERSFIRDC